MSKVNLLGGHFCFLE